MREQDKNVHNQEELDRNTVRINVYVRIPGSLEVLDYREMTLLKQSTMQEAAVECYNVRSTNMCFAVLLFRNT